MKRYNKILALAALPAALMMTGCDNVEDGPGRFEKKDRIESDRVVLVMEFTGQRCPNCPQGAQSVNDMYAAYPENVIAVALHPYDHILTDYLGVQDPGLRSEEATVMYNYYKPDGFPAAVFNGTIMDSSTGAWNGTFRKELIKKPQAEIELSRSYDETSRELKVRYSINYLDNVQTETNIQVWITESGIVAPQINEGTPKLIPNYVHNHVLRASMTGDWGESLGDSHKYGEVVHGEASYTLPAEWDAEKCHVVAFVQRVSDKYVLQAGEVEVIEGAEEE